MCTTDGRKLARQLSVTIEGSAAFAVSDADVNEGPGAALAFEVSLSRRLRTEAWVDVATRDGTALAGADYEAVARTLVFAPGETLKTVAVAVLDDAHDEGRETLTLVLSNAAGAAIADAEGTGTIVNSDAMPRAWLARFGRTVASHVVDALAQRLDGTAPPHLQLGGHRIGDPADPRAAAPAGRLSPQRSVREEAGNGRDMTLDDLLLRSSFHLASTPEAPAAGPRLSAWGRAANSRFDGRRDALSLDGAVTTATLGVDAVWNRWLSGLMLAYSEGDGAYTEIDAGRGDVAGTLTSVHPYVAYALSERVKVWGLLGYGEGTLRLLPASVPPCTPT